MDTSDTGKIQVIRIWGNNIRIWRDRAGVHRSDKPNYQDVVMITQDGELSEIGSTYTELPEQTRLQEDAHSLGLVARRRQSNPKKASQG